MPEAFVLGGTGQIGRALARRFLEAGWDVRVGSRGELPPGLDVQHVRVDRSEGKSLDGAVGDVDVLVDLIAYSEADARQLLALEGRVGSLIVVSSMAVYADDEGRSMDDADGVDAFPKLPVPIPETQRTVPPGDSTYATRKVALEQALLAGPSPATVLRPGAIYGRGSPLAREWFFVKRCLDGRRAVILGDEGRSVFHTTSVENIAELALVAPAVPARASSTAATRSRPAWSRSPGRLPRSSATNGRRSCSGIPSPAASARARGDARGRSSST
jgi:nucleoside-diphosphate-sugar epimerase